MGSQDGQASVAGHDPGNGRIHREGARFRHIRKALYSKYPQYPDQAALGEADSVIMEVTPGNVSRGIE